MNKTNTDYLKYFWPMRHYLVTCGCGERANIIPVGFCMHVSKDPPMIACAIGQKMYSSELIQLTPEFVINVPTQDMNRQIYYCGFHSGRDVNKFKETGLTPHPSQNISPPIIRECVAHIECRVEQSLNWGDKILFIATVVDAYADKDVELGERSVEYAAGGFPEKVYGGRFARDNNKGV